MKKEEEKIPNFPQSPSKHRLWLVKVEPLLE